MRMPWVVAALVIAVLVWACVPGSKFVDTTVQGVPNLSSAAPRVWGMGQPESDAAWEYARSVVAPHGELVSVLKLDDDAEGDDSYAATMPGWTVLDRHMPPEDDKPWTVFVLPDRETVNVTLDAAEAAYDRGDVLVFHCKHGRDRTRFTMALFMRRRFGWSKQRGWDYMIANGFRWELPDLDLYYSGT